MNTGPVGGVSAFERRSAGRQVLHPFHLHGPLVSTPGDAHMSDARIGSRRPDGGGMEAVTSSGVPRRGAL